MMTRYPVRVPQPAPTRAAATLNWEGCAVYRLNRVVACCAFPDERSRWKPSARRKLVELFDAVQHDGVVSSHELAATLQLGRVAKERSFPWSADLGDLVLSFYTPERSKEESQRLGGRICRNSECVSVTTEAAKRLLADRYGVSGWRFVVLTQGYAPEAGSGGAPG